MFSAIDHAHMARALRLAERGLATTQPNPRVGCVLAHGDAVVGEGWHRRAGGPHAEVLALEAAGARARGATAYVTLEPCGLAGRTPPCADALVAAGVARVVIAAEDAFQRDGEAIARLRAAGLAVETGLLREAARELNRGFFSRIERGRPWLRVKLAMSLDGRTALANGESKWITGAAARADVQRWRARSSALVTGSGTVLADDPALTVRAVEPHPHPGPHLEGRLEEFAFDRHSRESGNPVSLQFNGLKSLDPRLRGDDGNFSRFSAGEGVKPLRVVLDRNLRTPLGAQVLDGTAPTLLLHARDAVMPDDRFARVECVAIESDAGGLDLAGVLGVLAARGMNEVQVEAGPTLAGALFAAGLVDELLLYVAPVLLGDAARPLLELPALTAMAARWSLRVLDQRQVGIDWRLLLRPTGGGKA